MTPDATEMSSAGIWLTRPSPTDSKAKCWMLSLTERPMLQNADRDAAEEVDEHDHDRRDRVALDELRRAVHRAVEVGFLGDLRRRRLRFVVGDQAGVEVGVDRHLLAGHRVEREAGADLGHATGTVRDHDELDHDEDRGR